MLGLKLKSRSIHVPPSSLQNEHDIELEAERCRRSLYYYVKRAWTGSAVDPAEYVDNWHIGAICEHLQAVTNGQIQRLIINIPPGFAKSFITCVYWPSWEWTRDPSIQSLFGSYDINLAIRDSTRCRRVVDSEWYQNTFGPDWGFSSDQNAKGFYVNTAGGNRYTFGMNAGGQMGWRGDKVIIDDPNNVKERYNQRLKDEYFDIFKKVIISRVNDISTAKFVIIQQRVAWDDYTGRLNEETEDVVKAGLPEQGWVSLCLPAEYDPSRRCVTIFGSKTWVDPRGYPEDDPRHKDPLLFPDKFPKKDLAHLRSGAGLGEVDYQCQYLHNPTPPGGGRFNKDFFLHWYDEGFSVARLHRRHGQIERIHLGTCWTFVTVDLAASENRQADWTVFSTWAVTQHYDMLLVDRVRDRLTEPKIISTAVELYSKPRYNNARHVCFVVEDNGLGLPIVQAMQDRGLPVLAVHIHRTDKIVRSATAAIRIESGQIFWPDPATPWYCDPKGGWEIEHIRFPGYDHDDQVDTTSLAAEAIYVAGLGGLGKGIPVQIESRTAAKVLENRVPGDSQNDPIGKRFFGNR
jgi:predicted phage terminase large subunit-like protein